MSEKRFNKVPSVSGFGSKKLRKPLYLRMFPESLHPFLKRLFSKDTNEWSERENEQFEQAVTLSKKLKAVEGKMGLLNPSLDEVTDNPSIGETEGMLAVRNDYDKWSPEVLRLSDSDESLNALDEFARDESGRKRLEDEELYSGLLASEELGMYVDSPDKQDMLDIRNPVDDSKRIDNIAQQYEQYRTPDNSVDTSMISTDSSKSKMSPAMKQYAVGLLKDFMTPAQDDPPQQVRSAGISRGGGTPFPSLLQPKPKSPRYTPKGLV